MSYFGPILTGRDYNFFKKIEVNNNDFLVPCTVFITFPTQGLMLYLEESAGAVEYSFNGSTVHGELDSQQASKGMVFDGRIVSKIWFKLRSGSSGPLTVRIDAWSK